MQDPTQVTTRGTQRREHVDVLVIGAGLSGVGAACELSRQLPTTTYRILEARGSMGGTWDLFRYPGVRSDSDMFTLGYPFRPWEGEESIVDGAPSAATSSRRPPSTAFPTASATAGV